MPRSGHAEGHDDLPGGPGSPAGGAAELRQAVRRDRWIIHAIGAFSVFMNLLMLTGPIFMLQVYDRVLGSGSQETLVSLTLLMSAMYLAWGLLDHARAQVLSRLGARLAESLETRVFTADLARTGHSGGGTGAGALGQSGMADLDSVQRLVGSKVFGAIFDLPWTPIFLVGISFFHPLLGAFAVCAGGVLVVATLFNQWMSRAGLAEAVTAAGAAERLAERLRLEADMVRGVGMGRNAVERWRRARAVARHASLAASDRGNGFHAGIRAFRMFLQSAILALGAWLVLQAEITPGVMIAASILLGRALAPIDMAVGQWPMIQQAMRGWRALGDLLGAVPPEAGRTDLPRPRAHVEVRGLTARHPGTERALLDDVGFTLAPGEAMGVIGASGSGKSTLARTLVGMRTASGTIRLDGPALHHYAPEALADYLGYLPQRVQLFPGTIAENIARLSPDPDASKVIEAARAAAAHELISNLPEGYDTRIETIDTQLSGGQMQRIGLARAFYGNPVLLVLDEPNANLDHDGSAALNQAIRRHKAAGGAVVVMAHRPTALQECDRLLLLDKGVVRLCGPREDVLGKMAESQARVVRRLPIRGQPT